MIPASYLFKTIYRSHFEEDGAAAAQQDGTPPRGGDPFRADRIAGAVLAFALSSPLILLGLSAPNAHGRRR